MTHSKVKERLPRLERIASAQAITDQTFTHICNFIQLGQTEQEVAQEIERILRELGAEDSAFPVIVGSGPSGSDPHAVPGDRRIEAGDLVVLDFGATYQGYCSDMSRTVCVGALPTDEQRRIYDTVLEAQLACLAILKAGITGIEADKVARDIIEAAGYGEYFVHGTGHGVGREVHEGPYLSPKGMDALCVGNVVTVEPGIYIPDRMGCRIEDMVVIEADGARNFTASTKELLVL